MKNENENFYLSDAADDSEYEIPAEELAEVMETEFAEDLDDVVGADTNFFAVLPGIFLYPVRRDGVITIIAGIVAAAVIYLISTVMIAGGGLLMLFVSLYLLAYYSKIIKSSAGGEDSLPDWPELHEIQRPCLLYIGTSIVCFGPAIIRIMYFGSDGSDPLTIMLAIGGCLYFPMALVAVVMFDSIVAINPLIVVRSIVRVPFEYLCALILLAVLFAVGIALETLVDEVQAVARFLQVIDSFYFSIVEMRLLGLIYWCNREKLVWFKNP